MMIGGWGVLSNREIVSFRSCVRCEAVCAREAMLFLSLGFPTANSPPGRGGAHPRFAVLSLEWFCEFVCYLW